MSIAANLRPFRATLALSAACVGMALAIWWQLNPVWVAGPTPRLSAARVPSTVEPPKPEARALPPKQVFAAISERFLFHPTRRPPPPSPPVTVPKAPAPAISPSALQPYTLIGIVMSGELKVALFRTTTGANIVQLGEGENLQGWTVQRIGDDRVVFRAGTADHVVEFPREPSSPAQAGPAPPLFAQPGLTQPVIPRAQPAPMPPVR
jgi:hypothetical protein